MISVFFWLDEGTYFFVFFNKGFLQKKKWILVEYVHRFFTFSWISADFSQKLKFFIE